MKGFDDIARALGGRNSDDAVSIFEKLLGDLDISPPKNVSVSDLDVLANSVNLQRLQNNPMRLDTDTIKGLYAQILEVY